MSNNSTNSMLIIMLLPSTKQNFFTVAVVVFSCQFLFIRIVQVSCLSRLYSVSISNVFIWFDYFVFLVRCVFSIISNVYALLSSNARISHTHPIKCVFVSLVSQAQHGKKNNNVSFAIIDKLVIFNLALAHSIAPYISHLYSIKWW